MLLMKIIENFVDDLAKLFIQKLMKTIGPQCLKLLFRKEYLRTGWFVDIF